MAADSTWWLCDATTAETQAFASFSATWNNTGAKLDDDNKMSTLETIDVENRKYYVKKYKKRGKSLRRIVGRSRVRAEWENIQLFSELGIPTVRLVAYGEETRLFGARKGLLVSEEMAGATDLVSHITEEAGCLKSQVWVNRVINRLSGYVRTMHEQGFVHNDLKWRNILADYGEDAEVYIIDSPAGRQLKGRLLSPLLRRGVIKDLACLDKVARKVLSRTQRLRFFFRYERLSKLDSAGKEKITRILSFFKGRE